MPKGDGRPGTEPASLRSDDGQHQQLRSPPLTLSGQDLDDRRPRSLKIAYHYCCCGFPLALYITSSLIHFCLAGAGKDSALGKGQIHESTERTRSAHPKERRKSYWNIEKR